MVNVYKPAPFRLLYAICKDDTRPKFVTEDWIQNNRWYKIRGFTEPLNQTEGQALILLDNTGRELHASDIHWSFRSDRFDIVEYILN